LRVIGVFCKGGSLPVEVNEKKRHNFREQNSFLLARKGSEKRTLFQSAKPFRRSYPPPYPPPYPTPFRKPYNAGFERLRIKGKEARHDE